MAVYERTYKPYSGGTTPEWSRFLVLPRYVYQEVFNSRLFLAFYMICFLVPLLVAGAIYIPNNARILEDYAELVGVVSDWLGYGGWFFLNLFLRPQGILAFIMALIVGPALVANDLNNNGLPLYMSRPFSRTEYVLGKTAVLFILLSSITWIPGLLLFGLQASFGGWDWFRGNWRLPVALFVGSCVWIVVLCLLSLAFSAYLRWKMLAGAAMFGIFFVAGGAAVLVNVILGTRWGHLFNIAAIIQTIWIWLFEVDKPTAIPVWAAFASLLALCSFCVVLLARKVRAYQVVR